MQWREVTEVILYAVAGLLIVYDVYVAFFNKEEGDTISRRLRVAGRKTAALPYSFGVLAGHFWSPVEFGFELPLWGELSMLVGGLVLSAFVHRGMRRQAPELALITLPVYLLVGFWFGSFFWNLG